jgi:hypothetical protein
MFILYLLSWTLFISQDSSGGLLIFKVLISSTAFYYHIIVAIGVHFDIYKSSYNTS